MSTFAMLSKYRHNSSNRRAGKMSTGCMVFLAVVVSLLGLLVLVIIYGGWWLDQREAAKHGLVLVDRYVQSPRWSKDGRTLFYIRPKSRETLWAYDVNTGRKRGYDVPVREPYDISPDGKSVVCLGSLHSLAILSLDTGRVRTIYRSNKQIGNIFWLPQNIIVFESFITDNIIKGADIVIVDLQGRILKRLRGKYYTRLYAAYGRGIVYAGRDWRYHYYDVDADRDRLLGMRWIRFGNTTTWFLHLSDRLLIYGTSNWPLGDIELLNLCSGCSKHIKGVFPKGYGIDQGGISPDMTRYSLWVGGIGESAVPKLYVGTFSKRVTKQLADFGCATNNDHHSAVRKAHHP